jgi:hypothetical protein
MQEADSGKRTWCIRVVHRIHLYPYLVVPTKLGISELAA